MSEWKKGRRGEAIQVNNTQGNREKTNRRKNRTGEGNKRVPTIVNIGGVKKTRGSGGRAEENKGRGRIGM